MANPWSAKVAIALAAILAVLALADYLVWLANHRRLITLAESSGLTVRAPGIARQLENETVPTRATARLAGTLLEIETDRSWLTSLEEPEQAAEGARGIERLRLAAGLAKETVPRRPASWRAAMVLGASRFLAASREGRWDEPHQAWRRPLAAASSLAPAQPEPTLLLAGAELSRWSTLSPAERDEALPVLRRALEREQGLALLLPGWVRLAPSLGTLFESIPDTARHWERLAAEFYQLGDLERYVLARARWRERLPEELAGRIEQARTRLRGGDRRSARGQAQVVLATIPELALTESFGAALEIIEGEAVTGRTVEHLTRWLDWTLDLCVVGRCPLDPETIRRLAAAIPDLPPAETALAALAAGQDITAPEAAADQADSARWNRYWIFRASQRAQDDPVAAGWALARAAPRAPDRLLFWRARETLARATGDGAALALARAELAALRRPDRAPEAWASRGTVRRLEIEVGEPADGILLAVDGLRSPGAAVELRLDGRALGIRPFTDPGSQRWAHSITPGLHQVEIEDLLGYTPTPRSLTLLAGRSAR